MKLSSREFLDYLLLVVAIYQLASYEVFAVRSPKRDSIRLRILD